RLKCPSPYITIIVISITLVLGWHTLRSQKYPTNSKLLGIPTKLVGSDRIAYHHVIDQMQWTSEFATDKSDLSTGKAPVIYYDRKLLYHPT
uniref:DUF3488 domain-containing protein n=1 Tax=Mesocestoides corti TaxID=53468 RepID=A0A5K3EZJ8_MESCO